MADAVTISLLPVPLALVHIPRSRLQSLSHPVLRHILNPNPVFFTVTANEIELSLFVDYEHVDDFDIIATRDSHSMRKHPVEISHEPWNVLQIDSHSDQLGEFAYESLGQLSYLFFISYNKTILVLVSMSFLPRLLRLVSLSCTNPPT